jgi:hypothetical protein
MSGWDAWQAAVGVDCRWRVGTALWLGAPASRRLTATVLDVHPVKRGQRAGYWQNRVPGAGHLVVLSGGTAQGVAMSAPIPAVGSRRRLTSLAEGTLEAIGRSLSPFSIAGAKRWFLEPPHMQVSLVWLPAAVPPPTVGDRVPVELRLTTAQVDQIIEI